MCKSEQKINRCTTNAPKRTIPHTKGNDSNGLQKRLKSAMHYRLKIPLILLEKHIILCAVSKDLDMRDWLRDLDDSLANWDDEFGFELVPESPAIPVKSKGCGGRSHKSNLTPISLPEKQFESWFVCKKCGQALSKA